MGLLKIYGDGKWVGLFRNLNIYLDGKRIADLPVNGKTVLEVSPGKHTLFAKMDWVKSQPLSIKIEEGEALQLKITIPKLLDWLVKLGVALLFLNIVLSFTLDTYLSIAYILISLPTILTILYYCTLGRNHFYRIEPK